MSSPLNLIPDAPIAHPQFDRLDRMSFVRSFAEAIRAVRGTDSVVLALAGPWGSGKSSLMNLVSGELERDDYGEPPLVMRFNPWWFSGTQQLVAAFLQQLGAALSRPAVRDTLGAATMEMEHLADVIARPGVRVDLAGQDPADRDVELIRDRVYAILERSDRRILIFMDDIDRLSPEEMTQLLLIVRAVADFPNTTYVLAFDYEVVCEAISNKLGVDGRTYLEKVVQLQIDVPIPGRMTLERMVIGQLEAIDPHARSLDAETQTYFRMLFEGGIKHFLVTPRACTRLLNVLRFTYPTLAGQVYFPDMLGLSCLMAFSSQSIQAIRSFSESFVGHCEISGRGWVRFRKYHTGWLAEIPKRDRRAVESIVRLMFPKVAWALNGPRRGEEFIEIWERQRRICSEKHFDAYFRLGLSAGEAADFEWQNMMGLLDDATAFERAVRRFGPLEDERRAGWIGDLLQQTSNFINEKATSDQAANLFKALMRRGDQIAVASEDDGEAGLLIDPIHNVVSVLLECLEKIDSPPRRYDVLCESVGDDAGMLTAAELLELLSYRIDIFAEASETPSAEANKAKLLAVLKILDGRIQEASQNGELAAHPQFMRIVEKWLRFGRKSKSRKWIRAACESDEQFVAALTQVRTGRSLLDDDEGSGEFSLPLELLEQLFDRHEMLKRSRHVLREAPDWLTPDQTQTLELLKRLLRETQAP